jgi:hypothetical protein
LPTCDPTRLAGCNCIVIGCLYIVFSLAVRMQKSPLGLARERWGNRLFLRSLARMVQLLAVGKRS